MRMLTDEFAAAASALTETAAAGGPARGIFTARYLSVCLPQLLLRLLLQSSPLSAYA